MCCKPINLAGFYIIGVTNVMTKLFVERTENEVPNPLGDMMLVLNIYVKTA